MIQLSEDCLVFHTPDGDNIPYSADMISVELMGDNADLFDSEFINHAAAAVFHYFRDELGRESVSVAEFSMALEKVLRGFNLKLPDTQPHDSTPRVLRSDLRRLALESREVGELYFFPRLRDEVRMHLSQSPQLLYFQGLRQCVKQLAGARRWSPRCQDLHDQIVEYLRTCMTQESIGGNCALLVK